VSLADFTLHRVTFYSNGMKPYAYVTLAEVPAGGAGGGTLVKISMSATLAGRVFLGFWFGFIAVWTLLASTAVYQKGIDGLLFPLVGLGMAALGLLLNAFGRTLAHNDPAYLLEFLQQELRLTAPPAWVTPIS